MDLEQLKTLTDWLKQHNFYPALLTALDEINVGGSWQTFADLQTHPYATIKVSLTDSNKVVLEQIPQTPLILPSTDVSTEPEPQLNSSTINPAEAPVDEKTVILENSELPTPTKRRRRT